MSGAAAVTAPTVAHFLEELIRDLGYVEQPAGSNRTKFAVAARHADGQPWCATFLVAVANRLGLVLPSVSAYTPTIANAFRDVGRWSPTPAAGAFAFIDFPGDSKDRIQHVGVVESFDATHVVTIEGNTSAASRGSQDNGGGVYRRRRARSIVVGYGFPAYADTPPPARAPSRADVQEDDDMASIYKDEGDRQVAFVREQYLEHLVREPEDAGVVFMWIDILKSQGADAVIAGIADSGEGQDVRAKVRAHLGLD